MTAALTPHADKPRIYLNTASCGLLSRKALDATNTLYEAALTESSTAAETVRDLRIEPIRQTVSGFINAHASNVAFLPNFSWGLNGIVHSLKGVEKVLLYRHDYPSLLESFRINNIEITWVDANEDFEISLDEIRQLTLQNKVELIAISHVQWLSGFRIDVEELSRFCKAHGVLLIVDSTQSLGALRTDMAAFQPDVLMASNYKWMNAGFGTGIMYASAEFLERFTPVVGGHNSYTMADGCWQYLPSVRSYEPGHTNLHGLLVLEQAIKEKLELGMNKIEDHNLRLMAMLLDGIKDLGLDLVGPYDTTMRAPIAVLKADEALAAHIAAWGIVVTWRNGLIRISTHFYNKEEDVRAMIDCLAAYRK